MYNPPSTPGLSWQQLLGLTGRAPAQIPDSAELPADEQDWAALAEVFSALVPLPTGRPLVVAHLAQSLDGNIATACGTSQWISGGADLLHTHRLRALCDAVIVGAKTVAADDPQLTVRRCHGSHPVRVVLDPQARLVPPLKVFDGEAPTLLVSAVDAPTDKAASRVVLPAVDGVIDPAHVIAMLHERGIRRILIEGGGVTAALFLRQRLVDRLHLTIAPVLIGGGRPSIPLPLSETLAEAPRPATRVIQLGPDWLVDCDMRS